MKRLTITSSAKRDLKEAWVFIAKDNPVAADKHLEKIDRTLQLLLLFPEMGTRHDTLEPGLLSLPIEGHIALYHILNEEILVKRLIDEVRDIPNRLKEDD